MKKLDIHLAEQQIREDRFNYLLKKSEDENEALERKLQDKSNEVAKLDKQFKKQQVRKSQSEQLNEKKKSFVLMYRKILSFSHN